MRVLFSPAIKAANSNVFEFPNRSPIDHLQVHRESVEAKDTTDAEHPTLPDAASAPNIESMSDTSAIIDAKVEAAEARGDAKLARLEGRFDVVFAKLDSITAEQGRIHNDLRGVSSQIGGTRTTIIVTAIATVIALGGLFVGILAYGGDTFGRGMDVRKIVDETIQEVLRQQPKPPAVHINPDKRER